MAPSAAGQALQGRYQGKLSRPGTALPSAGRATAAGATAAEIEAMDDLIRIFSERGDLAHLALFLWASSASALAILVLRELAAAARRFDDFGRELARFNKRFGGQEARTINHEGPGMMDTLHTVLRRSREYGAATMSASANSHHLTASPAGVTRTRSPRAKTNGETRSRKR